MTPTVPDDDDDDDDAVEEVSTDGRDVTDVSEVAGQLAGATSAIADQLSMITEEMNKLRSELYSDNGLGSIRRELDALRSGGLEQIQQQVEQIAASADTTSSSGARARPAAASSSRARAAQERADEEGRADAPQARRVSFDRDTRDVARRHGAGKAAMAPRSRQQQELRGLAAAAGGGGGAAGGGLSWGPYLLVLVLVCLGPARPLIRPMVDLMLAFLWPATDEETPWYDAPYEG